MTSLQNSFSVQLLLIMTVSWHGWHTSIYFNSCYLISTEWTHLAIKVFTGIKQLKRSDNKRWVPPTSTARLWLSKDTTHKLRFIANGIPPVKQTATIRYRAVLPHTAMTNFSFFLQIFYPFPAAFNEQQQTTEKTTTVFFKSRSQIWPPRRKKSTFFTLRW